MKAIFYTLAACVMVVSCGGARSKSKSQSTVVAPQMVDIEVVNSFSHQTDAYTQGLQFVDGVMWEGTGEYGRSRLQYTDMATGKTTVVSTLPKEHFGEGITLLGDKLYQLTWESHVCHVYDVATGKKLRDFRYAGEGWGLTSDGEKLFMSNGSANIYKLNPETFSREATITVTLRGEPVRFINELEWIDGKIWANVYTTDRVLIIDPKTGVVEGMIDFTGLLKEEDVSDNTDVFNGIAYDAATKRIFVTGKNWNKLFEVEIVKR